MLNDISDLQIGSSDISITALPEGKSVIFTPKEMKELKELKSIKVTPEPEPEIEEQLDIKMDDNEDEEDKKDLSNLLFISDCPQPKFSLHQFESCVTYQKELFQNRTIENIFELGAKFIWINLKDNDARQWCMKNLKKKCKFNVTIVYGGAANMGWINSLSSFLEKKPAIISRNKLTKIQSFSADHFVSEIMDDMIKLKKPVYGIYHLLRDTFSSSKKA